MSFARISELLHIRERSRKETNELTGLIQNHASENVITELGAQIEIFQTKIDAMNHRFDAVNQRIDETNQRFDLMKKSIRWLIALTESIGSTIIGILIRIWLNTNSMQFYLL
ncbi:MAG: hypothetical protein OXF06_11665 [Bacteroidetes bacterium]|nr:hypothetical protein [Bacteroidota bacterium]